MKIQSPKPNGRRTSRVRGKSTHRTKNDQPEHLLKSYENANSSPAAPASRPDRDSIIEALQNERVMGFLYEMMFYYLETDPDLLLAQKDLKEKATTIIAEEVARKVATARITKIRRQLPGLIKKEIKPVLESHFQSRPEPIVVRENFDAPVSVLPGIHHWKFRTLLKILSTTTHDGFPAPIWMYGPPGTSKTHMAAEAAKVLKVPFYPAALGPTSTEAKLLGYQNLINGTFVPGLLHEPYTNGGLAFLDEVDCADPGVLVGLNSLLSGSSFRFSNGTTVERHPEFFVLAAGNTDGSGARDGFTRNKIDAAFLDRFAKLKVEYDRVLERALTHNHPWTSYIHRLRDFLAEHSVRNHYLSLRHIFRGISLLENGMSGREVTDLVVLQSLEDKLSNTITNTIGHYRP